MFTVPIEKPNQGKINKGGHYEENRTYLKRLSVVEVMFNFMHSK